jgi:hypothetical protein
MKKISIRELAESALKQMETDGKAKNTILSYRHTAFRAIIQYFKQSGESDYSKTLIDECILSLRSEYENGRVKKHRWKIIRRGGELLKFYYENETLELPICRSWEVLHNPVRRKPTEAEIADPDSIWGLIARTKQEMRKLGHPKDTIDFYERSFSRILKAHINCGLSVYSPELLNEMVSDMRKEYESGSFNIHMFRFYHLCHHLLKYFFRLLVKNYHLLLHLTQQTPFQSPLTFKHSFI